ncbi:MAG: hypothetical protein RJB01_1570 [Actinomycetota bacterium]
MAGEGSNVELPISEGDVIRLAAALIDVPSESGSEGPLADAVEQALRAHAHLEVTRVGNSVVARTLLGRAQRVLIGGHLDTVPAHGNIPHRIEGEWLLGLGAVDMKSAVAIALLLASEIAEPVLDVTYVFYECEEIDASRNGLGVIMREQPELLGCDFAILMEPSNGIVEAGCQGTMRAEITVPGVRAHSARAWQGSNAIHAAGEILSRLSTYQPERPVVDGLEYREGINAVGIRGGVAGNVIPDECTVTVNYRFAPHRSEEQALAHLREVLNVPAATWNVVDSAAGARPGLDQPAVQEFIAAIGTEVAPKYGWTDVARFSALDVPAVNFGPGDPSLAHHADERVSTSQVRDVFERMRRWLVTHPASDAN